MELLFLYLWLKLDAFGTAFFAMACGFAVLAAISTIFFAEEGRKFPRWLKAIYACVVLSGAISVLLPSKTEMAVLVGGHYALKAAETPEAAKIVSVLRKKANELLDAELKK